VKNPLCPLEEKEEDEEDEWKHPLLFDARKLHGSSKGFPKTRAAVEDTLDQILPFLVCQHLPGHWSGCHREPLLSVVQQQHDLVQEPADQML
jgi:hypothetical protein